MKSNQDKQILVTGANGEIGHGLLTELHKKGYLIVAIDINALDRRLYPFIKKFHKVNITSSITLEKIFQKYNFSSIFHLAAVLSTGGEKNPELAHTVNVEGTFNLLSLANKYARRNNQVIKFIYPSTIAVYGMGSIKAKNQSIKVKENEYLKPITMYGINKLYCENLGNYFSTYYSQLNAKNLFIDFRSVRFPGIISADTIPSGGTSDYGPEMLHHAAKGLTYKCFVRPDTTMPFMVMSDAVKALIQLNEADIKSLKTKIYNLTSFSVSASDFEKIIKKYFSSFVIDYFVDQKRQHIVDSWPKDMNDSSARKDWGWKPRFNFEKSFKEYLIPAIMKKYMEI
ncbi:MAG TPA: NAD-dependent epimerase/dehydratase family protein [Patescibacteria group bacterium]|nr:NAD-dependent epimerase/dehydratase family protein [Patescibacteria group bacterium]